MDVLDTEFLRVFYTNQSRGLGSAYIFELADAHFIKFAMFLA